MLETSAFLRYGEEYDLYSGIRILFTTDGMGPMRHNNYAVTEIVSFILVVLIVSSATTAVLLWSGPALEQAKTSINLESTFLQLKALSGSINQVAGQGVNSSQEINVETENGNFYFDALSERVVIYYSICDYDPMGAPPRNYPFDFDILDGFEIRVPAQYPRSFTIDIVTNPFPTDVTYELHKGGRVYDCNPIRYSGNPSDPSYLVEFDEPITDETNNKACIRILEFDPLPLPGDYVREYGEIWVFDLGSLNYEIASGPTSKAVVENGGIAKVTTGGYLADEPPVWDKNLLNYSNMTVLRIINISSGEFKSIGGTGAFKTRFGVTARELQILESRTQVLGNIKMKIYGEDSVVSAWYNFYKYNMDFEDNLLDDKGISLSVKRDGEKTKPNHMFSLVYVDCKIDMEAIS